MTDDSTLPPDLGASLTRVADALERLDTRDSSRIEQNPHQRRRRIIELLGVSDFDNAEAEIRSLLDEQWKVPENIYLFGILMLLQGRLEPARAVIDRSFELKPWLTEVPLWCGSLRTRLRDALDRDPTWAWARCRFELDAFVNYGMTLGSVLSSRFEHDQVQLLQVGANDGVTTDPLHRWIKKFNWRAVLLEPMPKPFQALQAEYSSNPRVTPLNVAIDDTDGTRVMWTHPGDRHAVSTFTPDRNILRHERQLQPVDVRCRTFNSVIDETGIDRIDVLQIDTEGYDLEILKLFDFDRMRPEVIHMEYYLLPIEDRLALFELLRKRGFAWRLLGADLLAVDRASFAEQFGLIAADPF